MGLTDGDFVDGVRAAQGMIVAERDRQWEAFSKTRKMLVHRTPGDTAEFERSVDEQEPRPVLWRQISGIGASSELLMDVGERRAGIRRLLRVVERMFRTEWKSEDLDKDGGPTKLDSGDVSFSGRAAVWEPLHEICLYLGISKAKLDGLSLQRTGLRIRDICDCIRVEGIRNTLRDRFRPLVREWIDRMEDDGEAFESSDFRNSAWKFLKWMRGGGRCETRKKFAFELGMTSRERLDRAVMVGEGETIEAVEIEVAIRAIQEMTAKPGRGQSHMLRDVLMGKDTTHGAGFDEVGEEGDEGPPEEDIEERETA